MGVLSSAQRKQLAAKFGFKAPAPGRKVKPRPARKVRKGRS